MGTKYLLYTETRTYEHDSEIDEPMSLVSNFEKYTRMAGPQWLPVKYMGREGVIPWSDVRRVELELQDVKF